MVLVVIILVAWIVILGPSLLRRRARGGGVESITHFHHQLQILEHSAPEPIVAPAYRLRAVDGSGTPTGITYPDHGAPPVLTVVGAKELPRPALAFLGEPAVAAAADPGDDADLPPAAVGRDLTRARAVDGYGAHADTVHPGQPFPDRAYREATHRSRPPVELDVSPRGVDLRARSLARRRRRDTLLVLGVAFVVTLLLGLIPGASFLWVASALIGVALVGYVAVLVNLRRLADERERKLHYLDPMDPPRAVRPGAPATHASGRYAHPSSQQAVAR